MRKFKNIEIDLDVHKAIVMNTKFIDEPANEVLRRLLLKNSTVDYNIPAESTMGGLTVKNVFLKNGLKLQKHFKGELHEAVVRNGYIEYKGRKYTSPSGAGVKAAKGSVNGWRFWDFFDDKSNQWKLLETLRPE